LQEISSRIFSIFDFMQLNFSSHFELTSNLNLNLNLNLVTMV